LKFLVIFNPHAAMGRSARLMPRIRAAFKDRGIEAIFSPTGHAGHATRLVAEADLSEVDGVVAAGGDGTLFEVLNGLYQQSKSDRKPLAVLPVGTGNAFARDLGLKPGDWQKAIDILAGGKTRKVDVGHVRAKGAEFHFLNILGMGFAVDAGKTAQWWKRLGNAAYTIGTLWQVLKLKSYPLRIELDGEALQQDNIFVEVSNTRYTGTSFLIAPGADIDDGLLDVTLLCRLSRMRLLRLFPTIYSGRHVGFEEITVRQASHIRISSPGDMPLGPDGEFLGATPVDIHCLNRDLEIYMA
jgi:YegS/Rv2252/BmrU family lipid kinase